MIKTFRRVWLIEIFLSFLKGIYDRSPINLLLLYCLCIGKWRHHSSSCLWQNLELILYMPLSLPLKVIQSPRTQVYRSFLTCDFDKFITSFIKVQFYHLSSVSKYCLNLPTSLHLHTHLHPSHHNFLREALKAFLTCLPTKKQFLWNCSLWFSY